MHLASIDIIITDSAFRPQVVEIEIPRPDLAPGASLFDLRVGGKIIFNAACVWWGTTSTVIELSKWLLPLNKKKVLFMKSNSHTINVDSKK